MKNKKFLSFTVIVVFSMLLSAQVMYVEDSSILVSEQLSISSDWEFYGNRFINPDDFYKTSYFFKADAIVSLPSTFNELLGSKKGSGTWHLLIKGLKPQTEYAFFVFDRFGTAAKIYCNTVLISQSGIPFENYEKTIPGLTMDLAVFLSDKDGCADFVIQCSNNIYRIGGVWGELKIGEKKNLARYYNKKVNISSFFIGALIIVFLYSFFLWILHKNDWANLFLALFAFFILLRISSAGFSLIQFFFPRIPYGFEIRIEFCSVIGAPLTFFLSTLFLYNIPRKKILPLFVIVLGSIFFVLTLFLPIKYSSTLILIDQFYLFFVGFYSLLLIILQSEKFSKKTALLNLLSVIFLLGAAIHDILALRLVPIFFADTIFLQYAFVLFAVFQSIITALMQERAMKEIEILGENLRVTNKSYYRFVPHQFLDLLEKEHIFDVDLGDKTVRFMTVLCADIRNFTSISEAHSAREIFEILNRYLILVGPVIREAGGFIEKYLGDGIIALFPEKSEKVYDCALLMQKKVEELRNEFILEGLPEIHIGIGIHFGKIVLGTVGAEKRMTEVALSKAIENAMKLESLTKVYKEPILVSSAAKKELKYTLTMSLEQVVDTSTHKPYNGVLYALKEKSQRGSSI